MATDACCPSAILAAVAQAKNQKPPFKDSETPAAVGHFRTVSLVTQFSQKRPFAKRASGLVG